MEKNYLLKMAELINYLNLNSSETDEKISMEDVRTFSDEECKLVIEFNSMYSLVDQDNEIKETKALIKLLKTLVPVSEIKKFMKKPDRLVLTDPCASNALVRYYVDVFELKPTELDDISSFIPTNVDLSKDSVIRIGYGIAPESDNRKGRRRKR